MTHRWRVRTRLADRFGQFCRVLVVGRKNTVLVEFEDGFRVVTCRYYVRRIEIHEGSKQGGMDGGNARGASPTGTDTRSGNRARFCRATRRLESAGVESAPRAAGTMTARPAACPYKGVVPGGWQHAGPAGSFVPLTPDSVTYPGRRVCTPGGGAA